MSDQPHDVAPPDVVEPPCAQGSVMMPAPCLTVWIHGDPPQAEHVEHLDPWTRGHIRRLPAAFADALGRCVELRVPLDPLGDARAARHCDRDAGEPPRMIRAVANAP